MWTKDKKATTDLILHRNLRPELQALHWDFAVDARAAVLGQIDRLLSRQCLLPLASELLQEQREHLQNNHSRSSFGPDFLCYKCLCMSL